MIKQQQTFSKQDVQKTLFNLAGFALIGGVAVYMVVAAFQTEEIKQCSVRYPSYTELSLASHSGNLLTPIELEAGLSSGAENISENAEIVSLQDSEANATALKVRLQEQPKTGSEIAGIKFHWAPSSLQSSRAGCLTYKTKLPEDIDFARPGFLPGFSGGGTAESRDGKVQDFEFASQLGWNETGQPVVKVARTGFVKGWFNYLEFSAKGPIPTGRWIELEQEIVTNTKNKSDGTYRLWVNGVLIVNKTKINWAPKGSAKFHGVTGKIGLQSRAEIAFEFEPKQQFVHLTPFQLRWE
ncbi:MAG: hypothetical protein ACRBCJ_10010 [Hyphomicrobiaceae bacterium]